MNTLSVIKLFPETKEQIKTFVEKVVDAVDNGEVKPLNLDIQLKRIEEVCGQIRKQTKDQVISEATKYGKNFSFDGAQISLQERRQFVYSTDPEWKSLNDKLKAREAILKAIPEGSSSFDEETGEIISAPDVKRIDIISYKL